MSFFKIYIKGGFALPQNDYSQYFKELELRLQKEAQKENEIYSKSEEIKEPPKKEKRKSKKFKFKSLNLRPVLACLFVLIFLISAIYLISNTFSEEIPISDTQNNASNVEKEEIPEKIKFTKAASVVDLPFNNDAQYAVMVNLSNNDIIMAKNENVRAYPASTTKIMTLLVACENMVSLDDTFTMSLSITDPLFVQGASVAGFLKDEVITVEDMLYGTILPSGADAAVGLAVKIAGSEENFVKLMNKKVKELGLKNTHFANVSGLHSEENYTTAYDMAVILAAAIKNPVCKKILSTYQHTTSITPQHPEGILLSSTLFEHMYGNEPETATILGGKTGFVNQSGYCVATFGKANESGNEYILVTFDNSGKWPAFYGQIDLYKQFAK